MTTEQARQALQACDLLFLELAGGLEPPTCCLQDSCAAGCATPAGGKRVRDLRARLGTCRPDVVGAGSAAGVPGAMSSSGSRVYCGDRRRTSYDAARRRDTTEVTMTTTPGNANRNLPGKPPVVDLATWQAARRRLPMVELDGTVEVVGPDGPVPFLDLFQGRDELVVYKHMWYDGAPHQGQCEGCTTTAWHMRDAA